MRSSLPPRPLVGRTTEIAALRDALSATRRGTGSVVLLHGATGVGKSRLAHFAADEAAASGFETARVQGFRIDRAVPYGLWANACQPLLKDSGPAEIATLTRGANADLRSIIPQGTANNDEPIDAAPGELATRIHWAFLELIRGLSGRSPLLFLIDDLHWSDASSLDLLHFVSRHLDELPVSLVCTVNSDHRSANAEFEKIEPELARLASCSVLEVEDLSGEAVQELIERLFNPPRPQAATFARRLHERTGGNPLLVEEVLKSLIDSGALHERAGTWVGWETEEFDLPQSAKESVLNRMERVSADARSVANVIAVSDSGAGFEEITRIAGAEESAVLDAIDELTGSDLVTESTVEDRIVYSFSHPIIREALYDDLGLARARVLHRKTAEALMQSGAPLHEIAYHFAHSGERSAVAFEHLTRAGRQAMARRADREAVTFLERAWAQTEGPEEAGYVETASAYGRVLQRVGRYAEAAEIWEKLVEEALSAGDHAGAAQWLQQLGQCHYWQGQATDAIPHYERGLDEAQAAGDPQAEGHLLLRLGIALQAVADAERARACMDRASELAREVGDRGLEARAQRGLMILHTWMGRPEEARAAGSAAIELSIETGEHHITYWANWALGVLAGFLGHAEDMNTHMERCHEIADELRSPVLELWTSEAAIEHAAATGRWDDGIALGEQAIAEARRLGQDELLPRLLVWLSLIYFGRGEIELGKAYVEEAWSMSGADLEGRPRVHTVLPAYIGRVAHLVTVGRYEEAIELGEAGLRLAENSGFVVWAAHRLLPFIAEAYLQQQDALGAAHIFMRMKQYSTSFESPLGRAWVEAFEAVRVWQSGDLEAAQEQLGKAADSLERIPMLFDAARLRRQRAGRLAELGREDEAVAVLREVHEVFRVMGAESELAKTRDMFREVGARPPQKTPGSGAEGLTERELEIARLVAERKSNKAIAKALGVSPRTVSTHLSNVFKKLEIGSRGELADFVKERGLLGA